MVPVEQRRQLRGVGLDRAEEVVEVGVQDAGSVEAQSEFDRSTAVTSNIHIGWPADDLRADLLR